MRIVSYNVNGIRAALKKGLLEWMATDPADIICLQETKARPEDVDTAPINLLGYEDYWFSAQKKGYSGVAVFTKIKPDQVIMGNGHGPSDEEGRVIQLDFGSLRLMTLVMGMHTTSTEAKHKSVGIPNMLMNIRFWKVV